jgi:hypothetical protein
LNLRPLSHEVREYLRLDGIARRVCDVLSHELERPLGDPSFGLGVLDDFPER